MAWLGRGTGACTADGRLQKAHVVMSAMAGTGGIIASTIVFGGVSLGGRGGWPGSSHFLLPCSLWSLEVGPEIEWVFRVSDYIYWLIEWKLN